MKMKMITVAPQEVVNPLECIGGLELESVCGHVLQLQDHKFTVCFVNFIIRTPKLLETFFFLKKKKCL